MPEKETTLDIKAMKEAIKLIPPPMPKIYYSKYLEPDDAYKMQPGWDLSRTILGIKSKELIIIVGKNAADTLIEKGIEIQNYKGDEDDEPKNTPTDS